MTTIPRDFDERFYYHIYNCGVEKRSTFINSRDLSRFVDAVNFYQFNQSIRFTEFALLTNEAKQFYITENPQDESSQRIGIVSYCLMPNHFHFLLRQKNADGISRFMSEISDSYTRYFNLKYSRIGALFQGPYKSKEIRTEESFLQVSRYIHLNPLSSSKTNPAKNLKLEDYPYSSYQGWIEASLHPSGVNLDNDDVNRWVAVAGGKEKYQEFVMSAIGKDLALGIDDLTLETSGVS